jgi:hypothetical protein
MRHAPIEALLRRIERETGRPVPDLAPDLPGVDAKAIIVLRDPGLTPPPVRPRWLGWEMLIESTPAQAQALHATVPHATTI